MKKTTKHVKFELPINNNNNKSINEIDTSLLLLSECKKFPSTDHKFPKISHISLLRQKLHNDINTNAITNVNYNSSKYHPTTKLSSFSSSSSSSSLSLINQSKRFVAARAKTTTTKSIYSTNDKTVNAYLTKSKISSTISPTAIKIKKPYAYATSRISHINTTTIPQSVQKSLQLINCNSIYLRSKLSPPPIDITRKFSTICSKNENSTNIPMQLSMTNMADKNFDNGQYQNDKMEMLQLNIPWRKIFSTAQQNHLTLIDNLKPSMLAVEETSMPSSSNQTTLAKAKIASTSAMKLQYVTQRIIAALFPSDSTDAQYRTDLKDATVLLRRNHSEHYKIFNLSKKRNDLGRLHSVVELGWPEELAPPLDRLCSICKLLENWLSENAQNVVVIHCKGGCSRAAIVIAAYMHYITICSNDELIENRFALQQFSEYYLGPNGQPSHKRYVKYFSSLLCGRTKIQPATVYLHNIILTNFFNRNVLFKIYERMQPVHTTSLKVVAENNTFELDDLPLRGDILVKCFQRTSTTERALFFRCQFNTCTFDLSTNNENIYRLRFYREELDNIFNDSEVNSQAVIEFIFLIDVTKNIKNDSSNNDDNNDTNAVSAANDGDGAISKSIADNSRADSYENFDKEEEEEEAQVEEEEGEEDRSELSAADCVNGTAYVEIHRPTDSTDSGLGSDSANISKEKSGMPPLPPPKPRINLEERMNASTDHYYSEQTRGNEQVITRAHSVLPASVRSNLSVRVASPVDEQHAATPRGIEPDLVAKDRYDPASKCFSYVPARALSEHFTAPRKPQRLKIDETATAALNISPSASEIAMVPVKSTDLQRLPETPKWEDDIEKITNGIFFGDNNRITDMSVTPTDFNRTGNGPIANSTPKTELSKLNYPVNDEEKPIIVEQAKHVSKRRKTKYDSYKTLNDDAYNSDLDDLCDPDFYLTYTSQATVPIRNNAIDKTAATTITAAATTTTTTTDDAVAKMNEPNLKSNGISGKNKIYQNQSNFDDYFLSSKPTISLNNVNQNREAFRMRNCRSATSAPFYRESSDNRLFAHNRYDSLTDAENADDWLKFQLKKLKAKRENNPEMLRRKRQEKLLLEELKHVNDDRQIKRENDERTYSLESYGKSVDPLIEYRIEEERLQNVRSPYHDNDDDNRITDEMTHYANRKMKDFNNSSALPPKPSDIVKHKPPTPPLRPRSQSPSSSPYSRRYRIRTPFQESQYQRERNQINRSDSIEHDNGDFDDNEFSHLRNIVKENNIGNDNAHVELNSSTNSMKSILKKRDVQQNGTSSPLINRTPSNSTEDWSLAPSSNRAATPAFPVRRETPQPYHPLLFEGAKDVIPPMQPINNITYRSSSPRSIYYAQSHRTSISSTDLGEVIHHHPLFVKNTSKYWYKPTISREDAVNMLRDKPPGTFVVRDSNSFPGAFGLALKVATPPPGVHPGDGTELVRHFLIEPSPKGVKLKGCNNEPVFGTLSALVYQHSIIPLALPTKLLLPEYDPANTPEHISAAQQLLQQGAACNVTYIISLDTESLTGPEAARRCIDQTFDLLKQKMIQPVSVHFKVSSQGITITDNTRRLFFRRHYPVQSVTYAGLDPSDRRWDNSYLEGSVTKYVKNARMFAFVARKIGSRTDNTCHIFAELEPEQPATAVVNFITKVMMGRR